MSVSLEVLADMMKMVERALLDVLTKEKLAAIGFLVALVTLLLVGEGSPVRL